MVAPRGPFPKGALRQIKNKATSEVTSVSILMCTRDEGNFSRHTIWSSKGSLGLNGLSGQYGLATLLSQLSITHTRTKTKPHWNTIFIGIILPSHPLRNTRKKNIKWDLKWLIFVYPLHCMMWLLYHCLRLPLAMCVRNRKRWKSTVHNKSHLHGFILIDVTLTQFDSIRFQSDLIEL